MSLETEIVYKLIEENAKSRKDFVRIVGEVYGTNAVKGYHRNVALRTAYDELLAMGKICQSEEVEKLLVTKKMRSLSGVSVITVLTKPYPCPGKCIYCPSVENAPKSYLPDEPAVMRAILNDYDPAKQVETRLTSLKRQGHPVDKIELIIIGGTFNYLPKEYQEEFVKGCFDALNGFTAKDLPEAKTANEKALVRCVGLTLETRPDFITEYEVAWFRYLGATRVEMGVQSVFDDVLEKNARGHKVAQTIKATKLLKDAGFKITYHLMPNLYSSTFDKDLNMFKKVFTDADFKPDYIKIYPCMVLAGTPLEKLAKEGKYKSYSDEELVSLITEVKKEVPYWVRIMRTIRDIPASNILAGSTTSNLRQIILENAEKEDWRCNCIRCREIAGRHPELDSGSIKLFIEKYDASGGTEFFLSYETEDRKLFSLLRLRLAKYSSIKAPEANGAESRSTLMNSSRQARTIINTLPELAGSAIIREVHTYGQEAEVGDKSDTQHRGFGKKLIAEAEKIAKENGYKKIAVISGVGVREYYRKLGYKLENEYMVKNFT